MRRLLLVALAIPAVGWPAGYAFHRTVTVAATVVPSTQANFPMLVFGAYPYLKTIANGGMIQNTTTLNGQTVPADLIFTSDAGCSTPLNWEVASYTATSGVIEAWVQVPSITNGTVIYMCYGNAAVSAYQGSATAAWDSNYRGVWHLPNGSTLSTGDSTGNANNGTLVNSPTAGAGQIDGGASLASASSQYLTLGNSSILEPAAITVSAWVNGASFPNSVNNVVSSVCARGGQYYQISVNSTGKIAVYLVGGASNVSYDGTGSHTLSTGAWYYLTLTYSSSAGLIAYVNAGADGSAAASGAMPTGCSPSPTVSVGEDLNTTGRYFNGVVDEVRISSIARSADWIATEYNNQSSPSTFYSIGAAISTGAITATVIM